jgi:predicted house-cleaning NTP pyrophosphatase (Maf/HAM1 superfamily)
LRGRLVLGADTVVVRDGTEKPADTADALRISASCRADPQVVTSVALVKGSGCAGVTNVVFRRMTTTSSGLHRHR